MNRVWQIKIEYYEDYPPRVLGTFKNKEHAQTMLKVYEEDEDHSGPNVFRLYLVGYDVE